MGKGKGHAAQLRTCAGAKTVEQICEDAWNLGIHYLTVYAFSTEKLESPPAMKYPR